MIPTDRRSLWLAGAAWLGAAVGWAGSGPGAVGLLAAALLVGAWRRRAAPVLVVGSAALMVAALGAAARDLPAELVDRTVFLTGDVTGTPRQLDAGLGEEGAVSVPLTVTGVRAGTREWRVAVPVRLRVAQSDLPPEIVPGQQWSWQGRVAAREPTRVTAPATAVTAIRVDGGPGPAAAVPAALRTSLAEACARAPGADAAAASLVSGIALGDEAAQHPGLAWAMQQSGLAHLTAVSGGNFVVVVGAVLVVLRVLGAGLRAQSAASGAALAGYAFVVGPQPSVLRAAVMAAAALVGLALGGASRGLPVLGSTVTLLLLVSPELAWSMGFALSVVATAALLTVAPWLARHLEFLPGWLALPFAVAVAAHVATAPLLLGMGASVSWVAVPANLVVAPVIAPITVLGLVAALLGPVAGVAAAAPAVWLATGVLRVAEMSSRLAHAAWPTPFLRAVLVGAAVGVALGLLLRGGPRLPVAAAISVTALVTLGHPGQVADWRLVVCDVGQGTAVLANTSGGPVLLDTGPEGADLSGCLNHVGAGDLSAVVLSHYHADHVGGLPLLLTIRHIGSVVAPTGTPRTGTATAIAALASASGGVRPVAAGTHVALGDVQATVLWPPPGYTSSPDDLNNGSAVLLLEWPDGLRALVPGDIEPEAQRRVMTAWRLPPVDVVVIPHHGSDHQDGAFAAWLHPAVAVASAGTGNSYGHPAAATLAEYGSAGASVWRTDQDGTVTVTGTPGAVQVSGG